MFSHTKSSDRLPRQNAQLCFMQLGTASPHPEASSPEIPFPVRVGLWQTDTQILESLVAVSYVENVNSKTLVNEVLNWRSGERVFVCY
jgi:hypothetical protein